MLRASCFQGFSFLEFVFFIVSCIYVQRPDLPYLQVSVKAHLLEKKYLVLSCLDERVQVQHLDEIDDLFRADDSGEDDSDEEAVSNSITTEEHVDHPDNMKQDHRRRSMSLRRQSGLHPTRRLSLVAEEESDNSLLRTPIPPLLIQV